VVTDFCISGTIDLEEERMKNPINKLVLSGWLFLFSPMINASASLPVLAPYLAP
jgi:hypothetical protein